MHLMLQKETKTFCQLKYTICMMLQNKEKQNPQLLSRSIMYPFVNTLLMEKAMINFRQSHKYVH